MGLMRPRSSLWLPKVTKLLQSKSGNLYLAVPMACCGLCLGPLGFRLHCILLNECGLCVISAHEVTIKFTFFFWAGRLFISPGILPSALVSDIFFWILGRWRLHTGTKEETGQAKRRYRPFQQPTEVRNQRESWMCSPWRQRTYKEPNWRRKRHHGPNQNLPKKPNGLFTLRWKS